MRGTNLDAGLGSIHCRFGDKSVAATVVQLGTLLLCESQPQDSVGIYSVAVSVDGEFHFIENPEVTFAYLPATLVVASVEPISQDLWA